MNQPNNESIWGTINTYMEIALNIYMITAKDQEGIEHTGILAHKDSIGKTLSKKAASMAEQDGDWLCFDDNIKDIPLYEVLQRRVALCKQMEKNALRQMEEIKRDGKLSLTDYFGECNPPIESKDGPLIHVQQVRNGIFFINDKKNFCFAVHEAIAENYMTPMAIAFSSQHKDYLFYDTTTVAIPLNELKHIFDECEAMIISEDSLFSSLTKQFSAYVDEYNCLLPVEHKIPKIDAPTNLFLRVQLEQEFFREQEKVTVKDCFNEETDYEIGG